MYQLVKYLQFHFSSTSKHGVHSPFVFDLITNCFEINTSKEKVKIIDLYKGVLKKSDLQINVIDFGAGSRVFNSSLRKVSDILKNVSIENKQAYLLTRLVSYLKCENILELGTSLGVGTLSLALGSENTRITSLEGCPETLNIPKTKLKIHVNNSINFIEGEFSKTLPKVLKKNIFDLVYFDGNHQKQPTIDYFEMCLESINNESVFIFDDIYWSKEMTEAWEYIKKHDKVSLTVDIYHLGFVFFRKEQFQKEHFKIKP